MLGKKGTVFKVHKKQRSEREKFKRLEGELKPEGEAEGKEDSN